MLKAKMQAANQSHFFDMTFLPAVSNVFDIDLDSPSTVVYQWRRPNQFQSDIPKQKVFSDRLSPKDIAPGILADEWFLSAVSVLAEQPALIRRLFMTKDYNREGVYRLRLCKDGRW